ncbi:MAG: histone family protein [Candidatus Hodarchaeota archaeon]
MTKKLRFANAKVEKIIRKAGAERVSARAALLLNDVLSEIASELSSFACDVSKMTDRKTVRGADVKLAYEKYKRQS